MQSDKYKNLKTTGEDAADEDKEKAKIPVAATHFVWAHQFDDFDKKIGPSQKRKLAWGSNEVCFASLGGFVYLKEQRGKYVPLRVNAMRLSCTRAIACSEHGLSLWELETHHRLATTTRACAAAATHGEEQPGQLAC